MRSGVRLGILLSQGALCLVLVADALDAMRAHRDLTATLAGQRRNDAVIGRIDAKLAALAHGTQLLADGGNVHAAQIVATLARNGVRVGGDQRPR